MDFYKKIFRARKLRFRILRTLRFVPDKPMLKLQYRVKLGRKLNIDNPERYTEKIQWYKLNYRDPRMQKCADKYAVREYVESKGLGHILNDLYAVFNSPEEISFEALPSEFVLKTSNGSGTNLLVSDKNSFDMKDVKRKFVDFTSQCRACAGREWVYQSDFEPVIVAEKYLKDPSNAGGSLRDYKILCFNGKPHYIICVDGRYTENYCHVVYNTNWEKQNVIIGDSSAAANYDRPDKLPEMISIAETLSADFPAARVDLYCIEGKIYFGEITFFPWSGYMEFTPDSFDLELGKCFELPQKNN